MKEKKYLIAYIFTMLFLIFVAAYMIHEEKKEEKKQKIVVGMTTITTERRLLIQWQGKTVMEVDIYGNATFYPHTDTLHMEMLPPLPSVKFEDIKL